ncbi:aldo/keto reductase [Naumannella halotolerans]|uniref:2,5-diketo-D-gluconate reductase A n=1 Tax=Naumannella halotolerans TaxID=993414 RepID=A0A4R7J426_9ACTN|nr:aldo/keto reductase [Naumannella halotolerans]TDT31316.1 2,5-diketo-D-gluconate reductase A [Naumannella halotolerans]
MSQVPNVTLNDGREIPQLGFGVYQVSTDDIVPAVSKALEVGYRHIDTAAIYGNEEGVGQAIAESGIPREDLWITTKLWNNRHDDARAALEESLGKLGLDAVDLYLIHWPVAGQNLHVQAWESLVELQKAGLARSIGVSNFTEDHLNDVIDATDVIPAVNQIEVHPTLTVEHLIKYSTDRGIKIESWSPLGQSADLENPTITELAKTLGRTPAQVILRWHVQKGYIVFPKSTTPSRIEENFDIFDFELSADDLSAIDALNADNRVGPDPATFDLR